MLSHLFWTILSTIVKYLIQHYKYLKMLKQLTLITTTLLSRTNNLIVKSV